MAAGGGGQAWEVCGRGDRRSWDRRAGGFVAEVDVGGGRACWGAGGCDAQAVQELEGHRGRRRWPRAGEGGGGGLAGSGLTRRAPGWVGTCRRLGRAGRGGGGHGRRAGRRRLGGGAGRSGRGGPSPRWCPAASWPCVLGPSRMASMAAGRIRRGQAADPSRSGRAGRAPVWPGCPARCGVRSRAASRAVISSRNGSRRRRGRAVPRSRSGRPVRRVCPAHAGEDGAGGDVDAGVNQRRGTRSVRSLSQSAASAPVEVRGLSVDFVDQYESILAAV